MRGPLLQPIFQPIMRPIVRAVLGASRGGLYNGPSLALRFGENQYLMGAIGKKPDAYQPEGLITFTRSTKAWEWDWQGNYSEVAAGVMRIAHDPLTKSTSTTPQTLGTGSYTFAVTYQYPVGKAVRVSAGANNWMVGRVTASSPTSVTIWVSTPPVGAGTYSAWTLIVRRGIRVEEQRTNLLLNSDAFAFAYNASNRAVLSPNASASIRGGVTADNLSNSSGAVAVFNRPATPVTSGQPITDGFDIKFGAGQTGNLGVYFGGATSTGGVYRNIAVANGVPSSGNGDTDITALGAGWYRVTCSYTPTVSAVTQVFNLPSGMSFDIGSAQITAGAAPCSYIPTEGSQVIRAADVPLVNTLAPWFNAAEGTLVVGCIPTPGLAGYRNVVTMGSSSQNQLYMSMGAAGVTAEGVSSATPALPGVPPQIKAAMNYKAGSPVTYARNGELRVAPTSLPGPTAFGVLAIGRASTYSGDFFNGIIEDITYHPRVNDVQQAAA